LNDWLAGWLPVFPAQKVINNIWIGLDQTHQYLLLQLSRNLQTETHK